MLRASVASAAQHINYMAVVNYCAPDRLSARKATFSSNMEKKIVQEQGR